MYNTWCWLRLCSGKIPASYTVLFRAYCKVDIRWGGTIPKALIDHRWQYRLRILVEATSETRGLGSNFHRRHNHKPYNTKNRHGILKMIVTRTWCYCLRLCRKCRMLAQCYWLHGFVGVCFRTVGPSLQWGVGWQGPWR